MRLCRGLPSILTCRQNNKWIQGTFPQEGPVQKQGPLSVKITSTSCPSSLHDGNKEHSVLAFGTLYSSAEDIFWDKSKEQYLSYFGLNRGYYGWRHCLVFLQRTAPVERRDGERERDRERERGNKEKKANHVNRRSYTIFMISSEMFKVGQASRAVEGIREEIDRRG